MSGEDWTISLRRTRATIIVVSHELGYRSSGFDQVEIG